MAKEEVFQFRLAATDRQVLDQLVDRSGAKSGSALLRDLLLNAARAQGIPVVEVRRTRRRIGVAPVNAESV